MHVPKTFWDDEDLVFEQWWQKNGQAWIDQLRSILIEHRNIVYDWRFDEKQKQLLGQYHNANRLLVECLNLADIYTRQSVREEIEATLLLPIGEIKDRGNQNLVTFHDVKIAEINTGDKS